MINTPKGQQIAQTIQNLQDIMAADAVAMEAQDKLIGQLRGKINNLQQTQEKLREKVAVYEGRSPKTLVEIIDEYTKQKVQLTELREAISLCERTRKYNGSAGACQAHLDTTAALLKQGGE